MTQSRPPKDKIMVYPDPIKEESTGGIIHGGGLSNYWIKKPVVMATVLAAPSRVGWKAISDFGAAHHSSKHRVQVIDPIIQDGDRVRLNVNTVEDCMENGMWHYDDDGRFVIFIEYSDVYYIERGEEIIPIGQHSIVELIPEVEEDVLTATGILMASQLNHKVQRGVLRWKGQDPEGNYDDVKVGDTLIWSLSDARDIIPIEVKGQQYARVRWNHLLAVGEPVSDEELAERKMKKKEFNNKIHEQKKYILPGRQS